MITQEMTNVQRQKHTKYCRKYSGRFQSNESKDGTSKIIYTSKRRTDEKKKELKQSEEIERKFRMNMVQTLEDVTTH